MSARLPRRASRLSAPDSSPRNGGDYLLSDQISCSAGVGIDYDHPPRVHDPGGAPRLPQRAHSGTRRIARQTRAGLHEPRLPRRTPPPPHTQLAPQSAPEADQSKPNELGQPTIRQRAAYGAVRRIAGLAVAEDRGAAIRMAVMAAPTAR
jgi:hypothetical protein